METNTDTDGKSMCKLYHLNHEVVAEVTVVTKEISELGWKNEGHKEKRERKKKTRFKNSKRSDSALNSKGPFTLFCYISP
jgi:hypothetical protein